MNDSTNALVSDHEINLVKGSWNSVLLLGDVVGPLFYGKLFELAPQVRPLFKSEISEQSKKLMGMLTMIVAKLDKLEDILPEVKALSIRHIKYGAVEEHFPVVGEALIWTLSQGLGDKWNTELEVAWSKVYGVLSGAMIQTMEEARA